MGLSSSSNLINAFSQHWQWVHVKEVLRVLHEAGYTAYLAGGCVRDALLGRKFNDFDVASSASPEQVEQLFESTLDHGKEFGMIAIQSGHQQLIEVTQFRKDLDYQDGRRPGQVQVSDARGDAERRDFTINALFYDVQKEVVIDYVDGQKDLRNQMIKAVGEAELRFEEDHLRILRALRFQSQLGFSIEEKTSQAIYKQRDLLLKISSERLHKELEALFKGAYFFTALESLRSIKFTDCLSQILSSGKKFQLDFSKSDRFFDFYKKEQWPQSLEGFKLLQDPLSFSWLHVLLCFTPMESEEVSKKRIIIFKEQFRLNNTLEKKLNSFFNLRLELSLIEKSNDFSSDFFLLRLGAYYESLCSVWGRDSEQFFSYINRNKHSIVVTEIVKLCQKWENSLPAKKISSQTFIKDFKNQDLGQILKVAYALQLAAPGLSQVELMSKVQKIGPVFFKIKT